MAAVWLPGTGIDDSTATWMAAGATKPIDSHNSMTAMSR